MFCVDLLISHPYLSCVDDPTTATPTRRPAAPLGTRVFPGFKFGVYYKCPFSTLNCCKGAVVSVEEEEAESTN